MNKIAIVLAVLVWVLVFSVIGFSYLFGGREDPRDLLKQLTVVAQQYINDTPISVSGVQGDGPGAEYIRIVGTRLKVKQDLESRLNAETKSILAALSVDNISNPATLEQGLQRTDTYLQLVQESDAEYRAAIEDMGRKLSVITEESIFDPKATIEDSEALISTFEAQNKVRLSLGQYVKAALEFVKSRNGYYTIEERRIVFKIPEDQSYYEQIISQANTISKSLTDMIAQERATFREDVSKIEF